MKALMFELYDDVTVLKVEETPDFPGELIDVSIQDDEDENKYAISLTLSMELAKDLSEALAEMVEDFKKRKHEEEKRKTEKTREG